MLHTGDKVRLRFRCTDTGGSSLDRCRGSVANGHRIPTAKPGRYTLTVTARDGAGNRKRVTVDYRVKK